MPGNTSRKPPQDKARQARTDHPFKIVDLQNSRNTPSGIDWELAAEDYIKGDYENLGDFARKHGLNVDNTRYHARMKDWQARKQRYDVEVKQRTANAVTERFSDNLIGRNVAARIRAEQVGMKVLTEAEAILAQNRNASQEDKLKPVNLVQLVNAARAGYELASKALGGDRLSFVDDAIQTLAKGTITKEVGEKGDPVWEHQPPDVYTFVTSPEECGLADSVYPGVLEVLEDIFTGSPRRMRFAYSEAVLPGGIGGAKSTTMALAVAYQVRLVLSLRNPHKTLGRAPNSKIAFIVASLTEKNTEEIIYAKVKGFIDGNKWMRKHYPYLPGAKSGMRFDARIETDKSYRKDIYVFPGNSSEASAVGYDILGACLDEATLWKSPGDGDKAEEMFNALNQRVVSRFQDTGWGLVLMGGSPKHSADFLQRKVGESRRDSRVYVCRRALWEVLPAMMAVPLEDRFFFDFDSCEKLEREQVRWDEDAIPPFHKDDTKRRHKGAWVRVDWEPSSGKPMPDVDAVPNTYLREFELRPERSKRDLGGRPSDAFQRFIPDVSYIVQAVSPTRSNPWPETAIHPHILPAIPETFRPTPGRYYTIHVDQAKSGDAYALALGHIDRMDEQGRPWIVVDALLRFKATSSQQVQLSQGREFVLKLREVGFPLMHVSYDGWQSTESLQLLTSSSIWATTVSVDKTLAPYSQLKEMLLDGRVSLPGPCPVLSEELARLELVLGAKVDHPADGCFVGDTRIPLLDGSCPTIEELAGKEVWVYSSDDNGRIVPGKARGRYTKHVSELVDVVLDSGAVVRCTPDHKWRLRDGSYKPAYELVPGVDRLMPFNQTWPVNGGYERVTDKYGHRALTHRLVLEHSKGSAPSASYLGHHVNGDKTDNRPENLEWACPREHARNHKAERWETDSAYRQAVAKGTQEFNLSEEGRRKHSEALRRTNASTTPEQRRERARKYDAFRSDVSLASLHKAFAQGCENANQAAHALGCGRNVVVRVLKDEGFASWTDFMERAGQGMNHKVRHVIPVRLEEPVPVYDLEVDGHHNFGLSCGVFVHNSKDLADAVCGMCFTLLKYVLPSFGQGGNDLGGSGDSALV